MTHLPRSFPLEDVDTTLIILFVAIQEQCSVNHVAPKLPITGENLDLGQEQIPTTLKGSDTTFV